MDKKSFWVMVSIALVVAVIVSLVTFNVSGPMLAPGFQYMQNTPTMPGLINAHRCSADGICEVNSVVGDVGDFDSVEADDLDVNGVSHLKGDLIVEGIFTQDCRVFYIENDTYYCGQFGYDYCVVEEKSRVITYYDSDNGSCDGNKQFVIEKPQLTTCNECFPGEPCSGGGGGGCATNLDGIEPYLGDVGHRSTSEGRKALCCR